MNHFIRIILAALGICSGCSKSGVLTPSRFTIEFAEAIRASCPGCTVKVVRELELQVTAPQGDERTCSLDSPYGLYKQNPRAMPELQKSFLTALRTILAPRESIEPANIVPVIKARRWLEEGLRALSNSGAKDSPEYIYDDFSGDLIVFYAEDLPGAMRFLLRKDLETAAVKEEGLRELACANLKRLLPKVELHGSDGSYLIAAGGTYEASLLLLDSIWNRGQIDVRGDIVVAIPTRDLLLVTGSEDSEGITKIRETVRDAYDTGAYKLTPKLFVRRDGRFVEFDDGTNPDAVPLR